MITIFLLREKGFNLKKLKKQKNLFEELKKKSRHQKRTTVISQLFDVDLL